MQEVTLSLSEKGREDNSGYTDKSKAETPTTLKPARIELDSLLKQRGKGNHMRAWLRLWAFNLRKKTADGILFYTSLWTKQTSLNTETQ